MDDAKTLSQADGAVERNNLLAEVQGLPGASNETKMSETEAFLAYCQKDDEEDDWEKSDCRRNLLYKIWKAPFSMFAY